MSPTFLGTLALFALSTAVSLLARRRIKRPAPPDFEVPKAEEGAVLTQGYGTYPTAGNVAWVGDVVIRQSDDHDVVTHYHANMIIRCAVGHADELVDLQCGGVPIGLAPFSEKQVQRTGDHGVTATIMPQLPQPLTGDGPLSLQVNARQLFGGDLQEGGLQGTVRVYRGTLDQPVDPLTIHAYDQLQAFQGSGLGSARPGIVYLAIGAPEDPHGAFHWGTTAQPKGLVAIWRTIPRAIFDLDLDPDYTAPAIGIGANPAEMIYDLKRHELRGLGQLEDAEFNLASFAATAAQLQAEGFGLSATLTDPRAARQLLEDICQTIEAVLFEHPATGQWTLSLLRPPASLEGVPVVTPATVRKGTLKIARRQLGETHNKITLRFRRFDAGTPGPVVGELLTPKLQFYVSKRANVLQLNGRNVSDVHIFADTGSGPVEAPQGVDYTLDAVRGLITIDTPFDGVLAPGSKVTANYINGATFIGYREATAEKDDPGNIQQTGRVRPIIVDNAFVTDDLVAGRVCARVLHQETRDLAEVTFKADRSVYDLVPGGLCIVDDPEQGADELLVRVIDVRSGLLEDSPVTVRGFEDVFGADVAPALPGGGDGGPIVVSTAPAMAIGCGLGGANVRIALFASDVSFTIRLWQADDAAGTNRVLVDDFPGTTAFYDTATTGKYYQAQLVKSGFTDGPLTPWITCTPTGPPTPPACVRPTWVVSIDYEAGTVTVVFTDPQNRIQAVRWKSKAGQLPETAFAVDTSPHVFTVALDPAFPSTITWEVDYLDCAGDLVTDGDTATFNAGGPSFVTAQVEPSLPGHRVASPDLDFPGITIFDEGAQAGLLFGLDLDQVPGGPLGGGPTTFDLALHSGASLPVLIREPGADDTLLSTYLTSTRKFQLGTLRGARAAVQMIASSLPEGAELGIKYWHELDEEWRWLDGAGGPVVGIGASVIGTGVQTIMAGASVTLEADAQDDVRLAAFVKGGDGTGTGIVGHIALQPEALLPTDPDGENPPEPIPPIPPGPGCNPADLLPHLAKARVWHISDCGDFTIDAPGADYVNWLHDLTGQGHKLGVDAPNFSGSVVTWGETQGGTPRTLNGRKMAVFNAAFLRWAAGVFSDLTDATMLIVVRAASDPGPSTNYVFSWWLGGDPVDRPIYSGHLFQGGQGHIHEDFASNNRRDLGDPPESLATAHIYAVRGAAGLYKMWLDGNLRYTSAANTVGWRAQAQMGNRSYNSNLDIGEIVVYDAATDGEVMDAIATIGDRWAIPTVGGGTVGGDPGSGGNPGGGGGGGPTPPPPPPPEPVTGTRPVGLSNLPPTGGSYFNSTIIPIRPSYGEAVLADARAAGMLLGIMPYGPAGPNGAMMSGGRFTLSGWKRAVEEMAGFSWLNDAIADKTAKFCYLLDEPKLVRRWGYAISDAVMVEMALFAKSIWPTWDTYYRIAPSQLSGHINGCDGLWLTLTEGRARPSMAAFYQREYARAVAINHRVMAAINCTDYTRANTPISVALFDAAVRAAMTITTDGLMLWDYRADSWLAQPGMAAKVLEMVTLYHSEDPP